MADIRDDAPEGDIGYIFRVSGPRKSFAFSVDIEALVNSKNFS